MSPGRLSNRKQGTKDVVICVNNVVKLLWRFFEKKNQDYDITMK